MTDKRSAPAPSGARRGISVLAALGTLALPALAADYYVSPTGSDTAIGTFSAPFATIQKAAKNAQPGDTIHIRGGVYRETVEFGNGSGEGNSGTFGNEITVTGFEGEEAIISTFDEVIPGQDGMGNWAQHDTNIWKISLPATWSLVSAGGNLVRVDGQIKQEARWPNVSETFNFDYREMAYSEYGSVDLFSGGTLSPYNGSDFYDGTYIDSDLPALPDNAWVGAMIDVNTGGGAHSSSGVVTSSVGTTLDFRYKMNNNGEASDNEPYILWNHLTALDSENEAFVDVYGTSGPTRTLYLYSPQGDPSLVGQTVELRARRSTLVCKIASYLKFKNLTSLGGEIDCRSNTTNIDFDRIKALHGATGLHHLVGRTAIMTLEGSYHSVRNSYLGQTYGGGIQTGGSFITIENNVIRRCAEYGIGTWGSDNLAVNRNTVAENGGFNIAMFAPASVYNHNHCYLAGLRTTDESSMNSNGANRDMLQSEVAYNWVHDNVARTNLEKQINGGKGIRLDSATGSVYNMVIHHNVVWNIKGRKALTLWALHPEEAGYGASEIYAYNNTLDGEIKLQANGNRSVAGHVIRNNIAERIDVGDLGEGHSEDDAVVTDNLFTNQGASAGNWEGNIFSPPNFVDGSTANFYLLPDSAAIESGIPLSPYTDNFVGTRPELGAYEYTGPDARLWSAGALILPEDVDNLDVQIEVTGEGERQLRVHNIPEGRVLPDGFAVKIGNVVTYHLSYTYSIDDHKATGSMKFLTLAPEEGPQSVSVSVDNGVTWTPMGSMNVPPEGVSISVGDLILSGPGGGDTASIEINGILSKTKLIPVDIERSLPNDLTSKPVPLVVDTRALIASGEMNPDGSNVRFRDVDSTIEVDYYIESGLNSSSTLFWLRSQYGEGLEGLQLYLALEDPSSPPVSDRTVLFDRYHILDFQSLCVWYSANTLANTHVQDQPVTLLDDQGARQLDSIQANPAYQPRWNENRLSGLPSVSFDGNDSLRTGHLTAISPPRVSYIVIHRNEVGNATDGRTISAGNGGTEAFWAPSGTSINTWVQSAKRRNGPNLNNFNLGKKANQAKKYFTGEIAEVLVWEEELQNSSPGTWELAKEYASRKYCLADEVRGVLRPQDTIHPARLYLNGQELTDFTINPDGSIDFTIPASPNGALLPAAVNVEIVSGEEVLALPSALAYTVANYGNWAVPLAAAGHTDPSIDIDGDGLNNLLEYVFDMDPESADRTPFWSEEGLDEEGDPVMHLFFRRSKVATDALAVIETTTDMLLWTPLHPGDLEITVIDPDPDGDGSCELQCAEIPLSGRTKIYRFRADLLSP